MSRTRISATAALLVLTLSACGGGATSSPRAAAPPEERHRPRPAPATQAAATQPPSPTHAAPVAGNTFQAPGVNPFVETQEDDRSTFAMDVDTASYAVGRRYIADGHLPDPDSVRVEEYVNAFDGGYEAPRRETFAVHTDGSPTPFLSRDGDVLLRIGIQGRVVDQEDRKDASLTFVIDTSGSMEMDGRLELVKRSLTLLVDQLGPRDSVAIVAFSTDARLVLPPTSAAEPAAIEAAIESLHPSGSTNVGDGLRIGYRLARESLVRAGINRVVLASDGVANVGLTDGGALLEQIARDAKAGIELVSVGVGMGNFNDALLEQLANQGDGFYTYIDDDDEARRVFVDDLTGTLQTIARDAKVQVEFDRDVVEQYRLIGFENRDLPDEDFRDPDVDAGEVGAGHSVTALYELRLRDGLRPDELAEIHGDSTSLGIVRLRWIDPETGEETSLAEEIPLSDLDAWFEATLPHFQLATVVAAYAEILRLGRWADGYDLADVRDAGERLPRELSEDDAVREFVDLVGEAARFGR